MSFGVVIPAAGQGKRMKARINKQYLTLVDRPVLAHTIEMFYKHSAINEIVVVVREDEMDFCQQAVINKYFNSSIKIVAGGETRRQSVYAGLQAFSPAIDYVIIHDGSRPFVSQNMIDQVLAAVREYQCVVVGVDVKDTIKKVNSKNEITDTLIRNELVSIQTPQAFEYQLIMEAHQQVPQDAVITDDASLVEINGHTVKVINGAYDNIKITTPIDLVIAETILKKRGS